MSERRLKQVMSAIIRHERAAVEVARLTSEVGNALEKCPVNVMLRDMEYSAAIVKKLTAPGGREKTHLWEALNEETESESGYGMRKLGHDEIAEYLEGAGCEHCLKAWDIIQQRKPARQELGIAKRAIRSIGRAALSAAPTL